jgi:hypothetical protein
MSLKPLGLYGLLQGQIITLLLIIQVNNNSVSVSAEILFSVFLACRVTTSNENCPLEGAA